MPLDVTTQFERDELGEPVSHLQAYREMRSAVEMSKLDGAMAFADARRNDLVLFRATWGGAVQPRRGRGDTATGVKPIERAAIYPKSHMMHFSILAGLVLFEGLANAYFFSTGSDLGLLGGWLQAITVSFTNVIAAFFLIGFLGFRLLSNPHRPLHIGLGVATILATSVALIGLNLTAAHFRDLLELNAATLAMGGADVTGEILAPVSAARANPFGFETLEALLLFILGTTFAAIAAYKGRTFSDPILGYAGVTKRAEAASRDLTKTIETGFKDARKMSEPELAKLVDANEMLVSINRDLAGPGAMDQHSDPVANPEQ